MVFGPTRGIPIAGIKLEAWDRLPVELKDLFRAGAGSRRPRNGILYFRESDEAKIAEILNMDWESARAGGMGYAPKLSWPEGEIRQKFGREDSMAEWDRWVAQGEDTSVAANRHSSLWSGKLRDSA